MAMLEMLLKKRDRVGLAEARAAIRPDADRVRTPRRTAGLAAVAVICVVFGGLWFSLKAQGPVLGPAAPAAAAAQPDGAAAPAADARVETAAQAETSGGINAEGLSLRPAAADEGEAAASGRVSLLPQRDQGPDVRSKVEAPKPPQLQVESSTGGVSARAAIFDTGAAANLAQKTGFTPGNP